MRKFTRCEKNLVKKKALDFIKDDIDFYIVLKNKYDDSDTDREREEYESELVELDAKISIKAFRYTLAALSVLDGVDDGFTVIENYHATKQGDKSDASNDEE